MICMSVTLLVHRPRLPKLWKMGSQTVTQPTAKTAMAAWTLHWGRRGPQGRAAVQKAASQKLWKVSAQHPLLILLCVPCPSGHQLLRRCGWGWLGPASGGW